MSTTEDDALPRPAPRFVPTLTEVVAAADASAPAAAPSVPAPSTPVAPPPMPSIGAATAAHTADAMLARIGPDLDRQIAEAIGRVLHEQLLGCRRRWPKWCARRWPRRLRRMRMAAMLGQTPSVACAAPYRFPD